MDLRCCTDLGCRISSESVVMNKGVLFDAICKTAERAWGPTLRSLSALVAKLNRDRNTSTASTKFCHIGKPREHRSMANARWGHSSSCKYSIIDFAISVKVLELTVTEPIMPRYRKQTNLVDKTEYLSIAILPAIRSAKADWLDCFSVSGWRQGTKLHKIQFLFVKIALTSMLPELCPVDDIRIRLADNRRSKKCPCRESYVL